MDEQNTCTVDGIYLEKLLRIEAMIIEASKRHDAELKMIGCHYPYCSCELCCILARAMAGDK
jgi:hypothetical protein